MFAVVVSRPNEPDERFELDKAEITIGRVAGNDIVVPRGNISRRHVRLVIKDDRFILVDLKSTNGTFVNGRQITSPMIITDTDLVMIGDSRLTFEEIEGPTLEWSPAPPLDPVEERLLDAIGAQDPGARLVYADWLEGRGEDARAEFLRIQDSLMGLGQDGPLFAVQKQRLELLASGIDGEWRMKVGRPAIEGCLSFDFQCPKEWGSLATTGRDDVRYCGACERSVFYCATIDEAKLHARRGECVAIDILNPRSPGDLQPQPQRWMGAPSGR